MINGRVAIVRSRLQSLIARTTKADFVALIDNMFDPMDADLTRIKMNHDTRCEYYDWFNSRTRRYYHAYSPDSNDERITLNRASDILKCVFSETHQSIVKSGRIDEFYFVLNDAYRMTPSRHPLIYKTFEAYRCK